MEIRIVTDDLKTQNNQIKWTDVLFIPVAYGVYFFLAQWIRHALAMALSFVLVLLVFSLFGPRERNWKRFILAAIISTIVTYLFAKFLDWPS
jgi:hypothetical protein